MKKIVVSGANGRMGREVVKMVLKKEDVELVGGCDIENIAKNIVELVGASGKKVMLRRDLLQILSEKEVDLVIDFSTPVVVMENIRKVLSTGTDMIVGTTGITDSDLEEISEIAKESNANILIAPNFAVGAVLMMQFAKKAAEYMDDVEIVELHHDKKIDSPSGTSLKTADLIKGNMKKDENSDKEELEKIAGARGAKKDGINIHSIRLPGLVAHQEVIFGSRGQSLKIRHDSYDRSSFMTGVALAIDKIDDLAGLVYGLEHII